MHKRSPVWHLSDIDFVDVINTSSTYREVLNRLGLSAKGNNIRTLRRRMDALGLQSTDLALKSKIRVPTVALDTHLVVNSSYSRTLLKHRLLEEQRLPYHCAICSLAPEWQNQPLVLVLDHINGVSNDNRIENLRFLCPNCNSQQATFAGRNCKKGENDKKVELCDCGSPRSAKAKTCIKCRPNPSECKNRPSFAELQERVATRTGGLKSVGKLYGVSDTTIRKWLQQGAKQQIGKPRFELG